MIKRIQIFILIIVTSGCSSIYQPRAETFKLDLIPEFVAPVNISIVNVQTDNTNQVHLKNMMTTYSGNKKDWTDTAIKITKRELIKRQAIIVDNSSRKLELSIVYIAGRAGFSAINYITKLKVKTSSGYEVFYIGDNRSPVTVYRAADGAVMRAVTAMLRDPKIVEYIKTGK